MLLKAIGLDELTQEVKIKRTGKRMRGQRALGHTSIQKLGEEKQPAKEGEKKQSLG